MVIDNVRIKVRKQYHPVYRALTQDTATRRKVFEQHSDLFAFCAVLGFREGRSNSVGGEQLLWSSALNKYQQTTLVALAISSQGDYDLLTRPEAIMRIAEGYADVGMNLLLSGILADYLREEPDGTYTLNYDDAHELEKTVLSYVQDEMNQNPFV